MIEPTQADRDAAAAYYYSAGGSPNIARDIREGRKDDWFRVQAFTRHRIEGAERMREAIIADFLTWYPGGSIDKPGYAAAKAHVQSMRALSSTDIVKVPGSPPT